MALILDRVFRLTIYLNTGYKNLFSLWGRKRKNKTRKKQVVIKVQKSFFSTTMSYLTSTERMNVNISLVYS